MIIWENTVFDGGERDRQLKNNPFIEKISISFQELIIIAKRNVFLMEKYLIRKNFDIFERIADNINEYYPIEKEMLNELINVVEQESVALYWTVLWIILCCW